MHEFKNWFSQQKDFSEFFDLSGAGRLEKPGDELVGAEVYPKVSPRKLMEKIAPEEGEADSLVEDFCENGGMILSAEGKNLLVEVECGSFYIPRFCVEINQPE